jgi:hypothetical protein
MEILGALARYIRTLAGERKPFTVTVPVIFPAIDLLGKYKSKTKTTKLMVFT